MAQYKYPVIPETITVHLGKPQEQAENIEVPFIDYIKNVAASEIYPTWPENAIRANIYAQITYALNRIYTDWYPAQGYDFDITNNTQFDQSFQPGRSTNEETDRIVDELFNDYVVRGENVEPYFTQYCNGTTSTCPGLSQWGTVYLAEQGLTPEEILKYYYGDNIRIIQNAPVQDIPQSYPGIPLRFGVRSNEVRILQNELNRIRQNYPAIPPIKYVDGVYDRETEEAVKTFQEIFQLAPTGEVDKSTWYSIKNKYNAVKRLSNLNSEGIKAMEVTPAVVTELVPGTEGDEVRTLQYYLSVIGYFEDSVPIIGIDGIYGPETESAVRQFQSIYGLPVTGSIDARTWNTLQSNYDRIIKSLPMEFYSKQAKLYPGYVLRIGMENSDVRDLQTYLLALSKVYPEIPPVEVTGYFGEQTLEAVEAFQELFGIEAEGIVGPGTWELLAKEYDQTLENMA